MTKTKCLGFCNPVGTTIAVYPEKKIFTEVGLEEVDVHRLLVGHYVPKPIAGKSLYSSGLKYYIIWKAQQCLG